MNIYFLIAGIIFGLFAIIWETWDWLNIIIKLSLIIMFIWSLINFLISIGLIVRI